MLANAHEASRLKAESARLVRITGNLAPCTTPAHSAPAMYTRLLYRILPAFRSGTTTRSGRPATSDCRPLICAARQEIATSSPMGPSTRASPNLPWRAIATIACASSVAAIAGLMVSTAAAIAIFGCRMSSARSIWHALTIASAFVRTSGEMFMTASETASNLSYRGMSNTKVCVIRESPRSPDSRATTAVSNSSV